MGTRDPVDNESVSEDEAVEGRFMCVCVCVCACVCLCVLVHVFVYTT